MMNVLEARRYKCLAFLVEVNVDNTFKSVVHAVAMNENRYQFSRRSIYDDHVDATLNNNMTNSNGNFRLEKGFLGAHSDIGGGYAEGDLSNAALMWIIKHAKEAGIKFDDSIINREKYNRVDDPVVHDSVARFKVFTPGSEFRWANDASKGYEEASIFKTQDHLELSWEYIKDNFENPKYKRFDIIKNQTEDFLATGEAFREGSLLGMLTSHPLQFNSKMNKYKELKQEGKSEGMDILINTKEKDEIIRITDYLNWVNCHYGLSLSTSVTIDSRLPSEQSTCKNI